MERLNRFITKNWKFLLLIPFLSTLMVNLVLFYRGLPLNDCFIGLGVSLLLLPVTYTGGYFVLGIQAQNSMCSRKMFNFFCQATILFFGIGELYFVIASPILAISYENLEFLKINITPAAFGFVLVANHLRNKYLDKKS